MDMLLTDEELLRLPSIEIIKGRCYYTPEEIQDASISKTLAKIREVVEGVDNPYGGDVHLDAGVYDGLYKERFEEARQAILKAIGGK